MSTCYTIEKAAYRQQLSELQRLRDENEKLRGWCSDLLHIVKSNDFDYLEWPEIRELRELGVKVR